MAESNNSAIIAVVVIAVIIIAAFLAYREGVFSKKTDDSGGVQVNVSSGPGY